MLIHTDTAAIGVGGVEHGDAALLRSREVDLIGSDAEAANREQALGRLQNLCVCV